MKQGVAWGSARDTEHLTAPLFEVNARSLACTWLELYESPWFYDSLWELGFLALRPGGASLAVLAATDTLDGCKDALLVTFSCKGRGVCPSCNAKRAQVTPHVHSLVPDCVFVPRKDGVRFCRRSWWNRGSPVVTSQDALVL